MTQVEILRQLCDGKWHTMEEIRHVGKNASINKMHKRGEVCRRVLFIPEHRTDHTRPNGISPRLKMTRIVQYRLHPDWVEVCRRRFGYE